MTPGRPLGYDPDTALDAAMQVFWQHGYEATSLQDLLDAMGLSKSSLYQAFGGKKELFLRCVNRYCDLVSERLRKRLEEAESGRAFIESFLYGAAREAGSTDLRKGCLLMNSATEFSQKDPQVAGRIRQALDGLQELLAAAVRRGHEDGSISQSLDAGMLAGYLVTCTAGIKTVVKGGAGDKEVHDIITVMMRAV